MISCQWIGLIWNSEDLCVGVSCKFCVCVLGGGDESCLYSAINFNNIRYLQDIELFGITCHLCEYNSVSDYVECSFVIHH